MHMHALNITPSIPIGKILFQASNGIHTIYFTSIPKDFNHHPEHSDCDCFLTTKPRTQIASNGGCQQIFYDHQNCRSLLI